MKKISLTIVMMLVMSIFVGMNVIMNEPVSATTTYVTSSDAVNTTWPIQDAINASSNGDIIIVNSTDATTVTYFVGDLVVNKSIILKSNNGSAYTWINGTINVTVDDVLIGDTNQGFTIYNSTITSGGRVVDIYDNQSIDNVTVQYCTIKGGYHAIEIGRNDTAATASNITISNCIIQDCGGSAIYAGPAQLVDSNITTNQCYNTSNTALSAIIQMDGGNNVTIQSNTLYDTYTSGGEGINSTGSSNVATDICILSNTIYNVTKSPICIRSVGDANYVQNILIMFNELENNSQPYSQAAVRFDNVSGLITATNISVILNNINTSGNDIETNYEDAYSNLTGVISAYFNWYSSSTGAPSDGTFRYAAHQNSDPYLYRGSAMGSIQTNNDYLVMYAAGTGSLNASSTLDVNVSISSITSTGRLVVVAYPYGLGAEYNPTADHPTVRGNKYVELGVSNPSAVTYPVNITMYYTQTDLDAGRKEKYITGFTYFNESDGDWTDFNDTAANLTDVTSPHAFEGTIWGNAWTTHQLTGVVLAIDYRAPVVSENGVAPTVPPADIGVPLAVPTELSLLEVVWYGWIGIVAVIALLVVAIYFAASPKAWKKFKKLF